MPVGLPFHETTISGGILSHRANALAERIEQGAAALAAFAEGLSDEQWRRKIAPDGRTAGVIINHVASIYPLEIQLAQSLSAGNAIEGVTWDVVADVNARHAEENAMCDKRATVDLLRKNSKAAADAVRAMSDAELDRAAPVSLNHDAPLTAQFFIEDHALRHSFHHLSKLKAALA
ncbi:MAG TPA: DUF664 domain-containing protein [Gemmatimonadaceae bacterium]|nr:DUF664 domain-containing protein [Gemmatimonadaceae bacterium]